jgi:transcriptional regulator with XRE-family HTH domain
MPKSRLPELIDKAKASGLSYRDIQRRAGGVKQIAHSTLYAAHKGESENLTLKRILALAKGLGESPITVFEAAIGKSPTELKDENVRQVLEDFSRLSPKDQNDPLLKVMVEMLRTEIQKRLDRDA